MPRNSVLLTDYAWPDTHIERSVLEAAGCELIAARAQGPDQVAALVQQHQPAAIMTCFAPVGSKAIAAGTRLRHVARMGIGLDNIDVAACTEKGVWVSNVPDYCVDEVSDHAIACLLSWARSLQSFDRQVRAGEWNPTAFKLRRVRDLTVGLIGYGRIARLTAHKLSAFGCRILVHRRTDPVEDCASGVTFVGLDALISESDAVILHVPLTSESHHLINSARLQQMRPGSLLVNVSRGGLVENAALIAALKSGRLHAALDVMEGEPDIPQCLRSLQTTLLTPHVAFSSGTSVGELRRRAALEVVRVLGGQPPENPCNRPDESARSPRS